MSNEGINEQAHAHPCGTSHHGLATANVLDDPETNDGCSYVHRAEDDGSDIGVVKASSCEDGGTVVELLRIVSLCSLWQFWHDILQSSWHL